MKSLLKVIVSVMMMIGVLNAEPLLQEGSNGGYDVTISSEKSLVTGSNDIFIMLAKDGVAIKNAKVKIKVFMPEMPGMPYMDYIAKGKLVGDKYKMLVNFSMSGTWQYQLKFKTKDKKVHKIRGSINL